MRSFETIDVDYAASLAKQAMDKMSQYGVPASPDNFSIWFRYVARSSAELNKTIDVLISNRQKFDEQTNRDLVRIYLLGGETAEISNKLHGLINSAKKLLAKAIDDQGMQISELNGVAADAELGDAKSLIRRLVDELLASTARATTLRESFAQASDELEKVRKTLALADHTARTDQLTGLSNRRGLDERLGAAQMRAMENGSTLCVLLIDIDHFKRFNDTFGHMVGDHVLRLVARVFKEQLRENDFAARYGGEELIGVLEGTELNSAREIAERIRCRIAERKVTRRSTGESLGNISVSIGVSAFRPGEAIGELVERADRALYRAKRAGRNRTLTEAELEEDFAA